LQLNGRKFEFHRQLALPG